MSNVYLEASRIDVGHQDRTPFGVDFSIPNKE